MPTRFNGGVEVDSAFYGMEQVTPPASPPPGAWSLYPKSDGWYSVDDQGDEHKLTLEDPVFAVRVDEVGQVMYVGEALPGTGNASGAWRIKRITATGPDLTVHWASGNSDFDKIWDNRLGLSYS